MLFLPKPLGTKTLSPEALKADKANAHKYDDCALGKQAVYVGILGVPCRRYLPLTSVKRVYKRLAVSKGFFEQGKMFATLCYLVIVYEDGKQKVHQFRHEGDLDLLLQDFRDHTSIPVGKP